MSNILNFSAFFPSVDDSAVPSYSLTVNRRSDERILGVANALAEPLYRQFEQVEPLQAKEGAAEGAAHAIVHATYDDELAWLADQVIASRAAMDEPLWSEVGVLTRDNKHAADVFDALTSRGIPVEIVGLKGLMRLPEVSEVVSTLALLQDLTANADLLNLLNGPRWAIGPRDLALLGRRARALTGDQAARGGDLGRRRAAAGRRGRGPHRGAVPQRRAGRPGRPALLRGGPHPVRAALRGAAPAAHRRR